MLLAVACSYPSPLDDDRGEPGPPSSGSTKKAKADSSGASSTEVDTSASTETRTEPSSPTAPPTCTADAQCNSAGRICESGHCIKGTRSDSGTPTTPTTPPPTTPQCVDDFDCVLGKICTQNKCVAGCHTDFDCPIQDVCGVNGQCVLDTTTSNPTAFECIIDGDCNPGNDGSGKICSLNQCIPGCHQDNQCPGVTICIGGNCL